jgi:hypothetical protein
MFSLVNVPFSAPGVAVRRRQPLQNPSGKKR